MHLYQLAKLPTLLVSRLDNGRWHRHSTAVQVLSFLALAANGRYVYLLQSKQLSTNLLNCGTEPHMYCESGAGWVVHQQRKPASKQMTTLCSLIDTFRIIL